MTNVVDLNPIQFGDLVFMRCHCTPEGSYLAPVVVYDPKGPIITVLMCLECEQGFAVNNGIVQHPEGA